MAISYTFSSGMCWECSSHPHTLAGEACGDDWEVATITFHERDAGNVALFRFLAETCEELGLERLSFRPRLNPYASEGGRALLAAAGRSDAEIAFGALATGHDRGTWARVDGRRWLVIEEHSIEGPGRWDVVLHAPGAIVGRFLGKLYEWNHRRAAG